MNSNDSSNDAQTAPPLPGRADGGADRGAAPVTQPPREGPEPVRDEVRPRPEQAPSEPLQAELQAQLQTLRARCQDLFDNAALGYLVLGETGLVRRASVTALALLKRERTSLEGRDLQTLCTSETAREIQKHLQRLAGGAERDRCEVKILGRGGPPIDVRIETCRVDDPDDGPLRAALIDLSDQRAAEAQLAAVASLVEHASEGAMILDAERRVVSVNPAFTAITGYEAHEVLGRPPRVLRDQPNDSEQFRRIREQLGMNGRWQGEVWNRRKDGERYLEWLSLNEVRDGSGALIHYVALVSDLSHQRQVRQDLHDLAYYDALTGLSNRQHLLAQLGNALFLAEGDGDLVGLVYLDLDRFNSINESFGLSTGDQLLRFVAHVLRGCVRKTDAVARLAADEFAIILPQLAHADDAARFANKVLRAFQAIPFVHEGHDYVVSVSIGIALFPNDAQDSEGLLGCADIAAHRTKASGRNGYSFYSPGMSAELQEGHRLEADLRRAIAQNALTVEYQPQIRLRDGRIVGCEALVRWDHAERGLVPPERFIPVAEESGLIVPLGDWVLNEVLKQMDIWRPHLDDGFRVALNVSGTQLRPMHSRRLFNRLFEALTADRRRLEFELTESALLDLLEQPEATGETLARLTSLGIGIAVDDFGTSYSSVNLLKRQPISRIKVDMSLLESTDANGVETAIASAVISMGHTLGIRTVAEGVETPKQLAFLSAQGCDEAQGYLFSPPLDPQTMLECLTSQAQLLPPAIGAEARATSFVGRVRRFLAGLPRGRAAALGRSKGRH